jgi:hypothetical protein
MNLIIQDYIKIIADIIALTESEAEKYLIDNYNNHIFQNPNFVNLINNTKDNIYNMYKKHLYELQKTEKNKSYIAEMQLEEISLIKIIREDLLPKGLDNIKYNKKVSEKINIVCVRFLVSISRYRKR